MSRIEPKITHDIKNQENHNLNEKRTNQNHHQDESDVRTLQKILKWAS